MKKGDRVRILNSTWTGVIAQNKRGVAHPFLVELDDDTMKRLSPEARERYSAHYAGPFNKDDLKLLSEGDGGIYVGGRKE